MWLIIYSDDYKVAEFTATTIGDATTSFIFYDVSMNTVENVFRSRVEVESRNDVGIVVLSSYLYELENVLKTFFEKMSTWKVVVIKAKEHSLVK